MGSRLTEIVVDCHDPVAQAAFWAAALDYHVVRAEDTQSEPGTPTWPGRVPWVVLADPEGNEFCVLGSLAAGA